MAPRSAGGAPSGHFVGEEGCSTVLFGEPLDEGFRGRVFEDAAAGRRDLFGFFFSGGFDGCMVGGGVALVGDLPRIVFGVVDDLGFSARGRSADKLPYVRADTVLVVFLRLERDAKI